MALKVIPPSPWQIVYETTLTSEVGYIDIGGLDINKDKVYFLYMNIKGPTNGAGRLFIFVENNYTLTNYYSQALWGDGNYAYAYRSNDSRIGRVYINGECFCYVSIHREKNGTFLAHSSWHDNTGSAVIVNFNCVSSTFKVENITTIRLITAYQPSFGAGTYIALFKPAG
jgi:hypothetical protein